MPSTKWDRGFKYHSGQALTALNEVKERLDTVLEHVEEGMDPHIVYDRAVEFEDAVAVFMRAMSKFEYFHLHNVHLLIESRYSNQNNIEE